MSTLNENEIEDDVEGHSLLKRGEDAPESALKSTLEATDDVEGHSLLKRGEDAPESALKSTLEAPDDVEGHSLLKRGEEEGDSTVDSTVNSTLQSAMSKREPASDEDVEGHRAAN